MNDDAPLIHARPGDADFEDIIGLVEVLRAATAPTLAKDLEETGDLDLHAKLITALAVFAGTLFGTTILLGAATDQDRRRATNTMATNFRQGIEIGKRRGERIRSGMGSVQ